jgi:hypothetical protein
VLITKSSSRFMTLLARQNSVKKTLFLVSAIFPNRSQIWRSCHVYYIRELDGSFNDVHISAISFLAAACNFVRCLLFEKRSTLLQKNRNSIPRSRIIIIHYCCITAQSWAPHYGATLLCIVSVHEIPSSGTFQCLLLVEIS